MNPEVPSSLPNLLLHGIVVVALPLAARHHSSIDTACMWTTTIPSPCPVNICSRIPLRQHQLGISPQQAVYSRQITLILQTRHHHEGIQTRLWIPCTYLSIGSLQKKQRILFVRPRGDNTHIHQIGMKFNFKRRSIRTIPQIGSVGIVPSNLIGELGGMLKGPMKNGMIRRGRNASFDNCHGLIGTKTIKCNLTRRLGTIIIMFMFIMCMIGIELIQAAMLAK
mmetsp:Transcript_13941/g.20808  ORF Transcript_13941/g.20808 Transcript_13941/m.20808 type:complete len:223 (+) Transcript_13941:268-936(+)